MNLNMVSVTIAATGGPNDATLPEGNAIFVPSGVQWPSAGDLPIVPRVVAATMVGGTASASLVASDNFTAGVLTWNILINIRGLPTINMPDVPVLFASGATQNVWDILTAAGWLPIVT